MAKEEAVEAVAKVLETMPDGMFRVELEDELLTAINNSRGFRLRRFEGCAK